MLLTEYIGLENRTGRLAERILLHFEFPKIYWQTRMQKMKANLRLRNGRRTRNLINESETLITCN